MNRPSFSNSISEPASLVMITVDEPRLEGYGPTRHTTYRITSQLTAGGEPSICRHRYSEFGKLRTELCNSHPGVVIPPLPDKQVMNRFSTEFVEKRRGLLQLFLQRAIDHPLACTVSALFSFLTLAEIIRQTVQARAKEVVMPPCPSDEAGDALKDAVKMVETLEKQARGRRPGYGRRWALRCGGRREGSATTFGIESTVGMRGLITARVSLACSCRR